MAGPCLGIGGGAIVVTYGKNRLLCVNAGVAASTCDLSTEGFGRYPNFLSAGTHSKDCYQEMWAALGDVGHWRGEVMNRKKSGEVYVEWLSIKRVINAQGQLTHYIGMFSDIMARKATESRLRHLSMHDALTDLPNRALLDERIQQASVRAKR